MSKLLWYKHDNEVPWLYRWMSRPTRRMVVLKEYERYCVTDANGDNSRELLTLYRVQGETAMRWRLDDDPKWLPDGRHLSFVYHDALYVVDAP